MGTSSDRPSGFRQTLVDDIRVLVIGPRTLDDEEFAALVSEGIALARPSRRVLVCIIGEPSMGPRRRKMLADAGLLDKPAAVLTDSAKVRGVLTALSWIGGKNRAFRPSDWGQAFDFLGVRPERRERLFQVLEASRAALGASSLAPPAPGAASRWNLVATIDAVKRSVNARAETIQKRDSVSPRKPS